MMRSVWADWTGRTAPYLRASKAMQERVMNTPNIKVLFEHNTAEVLGDETGVTANKMFMIFSPFREKLKNLFHKKGPRKGALECPLGKPHIDYA